MLKDLLNFDNPSESQEAMRAAQKLSKYMADAVVQGGKLIQSHLSEEETVQMAKGMTAAWAACHDEQSEVVLLLALAQTTIIRLVTVSMIAGMQIAIDEEWY